MHKKYPLLNIFKLDFFGVLLFIFLNFLPIVSNAKDWVLFENSVEVSDYTKIIQWIQPGDNIDVGNKRFQIVGILGSGNTTKIFDIGNGYALRLPLASGYFRGKVDYKQFINRFYEGYHELAQSGIKIVEVSEEFSSPPNYIVVNKVNTKYDLAEFSNGWILVSEWEREFANSKLVDFARSAASYRVIGDFHPAQLRWTGEEWILMDYANNSSLATYIYDRTIFTSLPNLSEGYKKWLNQMTQELRRSPGTTITSRPALMPNSCVSIFTTM